MKQQLRLIIEKYLLNEIGDLPAGADTDSNAPYNQGPDLTIKSYKINDQDGVFEVSLSNNNYVEITFEDFLEQYWISVPHSFNSHAAQFEDDGTFELKIIQMLRDQQYDFTDILLNIVESDSNNFN